MRGYSVYMPNAARRNSNERNRLRQANEEREANPESRYQESGGDLHHATQTPNPTTSPTLSEILAVDLGQEGDGGASTLR